MDLETNLKIHNYDTNKETKFFVNDFIWNSKKIYSDLGLSSQLLSNIKNINYEANNIDIYKKDVTNELHGALGLLSELRLQKNIDNSIHTLIPKILLRYAPGDMRKENDGSRLDPVRAFSMNKVNNINNFEKGSSSTLGFDYKIKNNNKEFDFSVAQVISEKENKNVVKVKSG